MKAININKQKPNVDDVMRNIRSEMEADVQCRCRVATSDLKTCLAAIFVGFCRYTDEFCLKVPKLCTDLDLTLLYILILGTYGKFARQHKMLALGVCFPQTFSRAGRRFAASRSHLQYY